MIRIAGISLAALILGMFLRRHNKTVSLLLIMFACAAVFFESISSLSEIVDSLNELASGMGEISSYLKIMFKVLGIALITQIISDICRDSGESALAGQTEVAAKILIVTLILPLLQAVVEVITGLAS
ncbi:MAG TPA: stage III sporulation AC/AD family protein [Candidatus Eubacterium faecipullorum]|uniref:Stage III sporulation AC/AD family protein n=1 Tax=Candidatus Eubacterium faecipullorum TaxID=2838571 RepID=A0A9D1RDA1_9FIRM|nr:stage III sporulation AC/AD family protein [Candidatus Eubacterium faecipullorum]